MIASTLSHQTKPEQLHTVFLTLLLPKLQTHALIAFRHLRCPHQREDAVDEMVGLCWLWYPRLVEQGKDADLFVSTLANFAAGHVKSGRRLCGQEYEGRALDHGSAAPRLLRGQTPGVQHPVQQRPLRRPARQHEVAARPA